MNRTAWWTALIIMALVAANARHAAAIGALDLGVSTDYRFRSSDDGEDADWYFYGKAELLTVNMGRKRTVSGSIRYRLAYDVDGLDDDLGAGFYQPWRSLEDIESDGDRDSHRLYHAYLDFDSHQWAPHRLVLGRQYLSRSERLWFDGATLSVSPTWQITLAGYGGVPVSFWFDTEDTSVAGGGIDLEPFPFTTVRFDGFGVEDKDFRNAVYKFSIWQDLYFEGLSVFASFRYVDEELQEYEVTPTYFWKAMGLKFNARYSRIVNPIEDQAFPIALLVFPLDEFAERLNADISVTRIGRTYSITLGYTVNDVENEGYANRNYDKIYAALRWALTDKSTIAMQGEWWDAGPDEVFRSGAQYDRSGKLLHCWVGTRYEQFKYDFDVRRVSEDIQVYYGGLALAFGESVEVGIDFEGEDDESVEAPYYNFQAHLALEF